MGSGRTDRRVKYTKMVLRQSLLELMKKSSIDKITVKDICELADVNRGTFYAHYSSPRGLLEQIENNLFEEIRETLERHVSTEVIPADTHGLFYEIFQCITANSDICMILLGEHGDLDFLKRIIYVAHEQSIKSWTRNMRTKDSELAEYIYSFMANGSVGVIQRWIQGGMRETPEKMADIVDRITRYGTNYYFGEAENKKI